MPFPRGRRLKKALFGNASKSNVSEDATDEFVETQSPFGAEPAGDRYQGDATQNEGVLYPPLGRGIARDDTVRYGGGDSIAEWHRGGRQRDERDLRPVNSRNSLVPLGSGSGVEHQGDHQCDDEDEERYSSGSENSSMPFGWDSPGEWHQADDTFTKTEDDQKWYIESEDREVSGDSITSNEDDETVVGHEFDENWPLPPEGVGDFSRNLIDSDEDDEIIDGHQHDQDWPLRPEDPGLSLNLDAHNHNEDNEELDETPEESGVFHRPDIHTDSPQLPEFDVVLPPSNTVKTPNPSIESQFMTECSPFQHASCSSDPHEVLQQRDAALKAYKSSKHYPEKVTFTLSDLSVSSEQPNPITSSSRASSTMSGVELAARKNKEFIDSIRRQLGMNEDEAEDELSADMATKMNIADGAFVLRNPVRGRAVNDAAVDDTDATKDDRDGSDGSVYQVNIADTSAPPSVHEGKDLPQAALAYQEEILSNPFMQDPRRRIFVGDTARRNSRRGSPSFSIMDESPEITPRFDHIYDNPFGPGQDNVNLFRAIPEDAVSTGNSSGHSKPSQTVGGDKRHKLGLPFRRRSTRPTSDGPSVDKEKGVPANSLLPSLEALGDFVNRKFRAKLADIDNGMLPAVSVAPVLQSSFYGCLELTLLTTTSHFLAANKHLLNVEVLRREVRAWESGSWCLFDGTKQKRVRVVGFLFPMEVQVRLMDAHLGVFLKAEAFTSKEPTASRQAVRTISGWRSLAECLGRKTLCNPDFLLMEHLRGAEKVLALLGDEHVSEEAAREWELVKRRVVAAVMEKEVGFRHLPQDPPVRVEPMVAVRTAAKPASAPVKGQAEHSYMENWVFGPGQ
ncbi:hypothetical protein K440DRAFT_640789 [Wilcoxina mikolae CBS 423.85]|nr:hypothetical protein K440DRAFT_640789 [Wilcoxina mikolae CBS 423.85]